MWGYRNSKGEKNKQQHKREGKKTSLIGEKTNLSLNSISANNIVAADEEQTFMCHLSADEDFSAIDFCIESLKIWK